MSNVQESWPEGAATSIRRALLEFYSARRRDLPWRRSPTPYGILVSEFMLQQTRVETALPYYLRWMARFPTLPALAAATESEVLGAWQGLGYYARARNLHRAAQAILTDHHGEVPSSMEALRALPGIGAYTAGAVASIAFGQPEPAVDGNLRRVLARLADDPSPSPSNLARWTRSLLDAAVPGDSNQALMELGATVCTPRAPKCEICPVSTWCGAHRAGTAAERPARLPRPAKTRRQEAVVVLATGDAPPELFLEVAPEGGGLGGLWRFPSREVPPGESAKEAAEAWASAHLENCPPPEALSPVRRVFTHLDLDYRPFLFRFAPNPKRPVNVSSPGNWVVTHALGSLPISAAHRAILRAVQKRL
jgi:A/G-specific adenine glycosylase